MPLHMAPRIRFIEETLETEGLIQVRDSVAITILKAQESGGSRAKVVPPVKIIHRGTVFTAS